MRIRRWPGGGDARVGSDSRDRVCVRMDGPRMVAGGDGGCWICGFLGAVGCGAIQCHAQAQPNYPVRGADLWSMGEEHGGETKEKPVKLGAGGHFFPPGWR